MRHVIKLALVLLALVASFYVYGFTVQVAPLVVAGIAAGSLVSTYIGLAFANIPNAQRSRAMYVARAAMVIEALYGFLYVLARQSPEWFTAPMHPALSMTLAALHGAAFSVLAFFVSLFIVHEQGQVAETPAEARDRAIVETLRAIVTRLDTPQPINGRPLLAEDDAPTITESAPEQTGTIPVAKGNAAFCKVCKQDVPVTSPSEAGVIGRWGCPSCRAKKATRTP